MNESEARIIARLHDERLRGDLGVMLDRVVIAPGFARGAKKILAELVRQVTTSRRIPGCCGLKLSAACGAAA
jgi:hypothetical protein